MKIEVFSTFHRIFSPNSLLIPVLKNNIQLIDISTITKLWLNIKTNLLQYHFQSKTPKW